MLNFSPVFRHDIGMVSIPFEQAKVFSCVKSMGYKKDLAGLVRLAPALHLSFSVRVRNSGHGEATPPVIGQPESGTPTGN